MYLYLIQNIEIELSARCVLFLSTLFETQLSNDKTLVRLISSIKNNLKKNLVISKEILGFNIQSINFLIKTDDLKKKSVEEYKNNIEVDSLL